MRMEIHIHGYIALCEGVTRRQVEVALRPLLDYFDVENLGEVKSLEENHPGIVFHQREFALEMCCTLEVGRHFFPALEEALQDMSRLIEQATAVEIIIYRPDGRDETQLMFVGPTAEAIYDAQCRHMAEDVGLLLSRQFDQPAVDEVLKLVNDLFRRQRAARPLPEDDEVAPSLNTPGQSGRRRLH